MKEETDNFVIRQLVIDMEQYGLGLISNWSVQHQKLLGDYMANVMHQMIEAANELQFSWQKKTPLKTLDMKNHALKDLVSVAAKCGFLRGPRNLIEWHRRCDELGQKIGGYYKHLYSDKDHKN